MAEEDKIIDSWRMEYERMKYFGGVTGKERAMLVYFRLLGWQFIRLRKVAIDPITAPVVKWLTRVLGGK
jgi:hypothetical protein